MRLLFNARRTRSMSFARVIMSHYTTMKIHLSMMDFHGILSTAPGSASFSKKNVP